MPISSAPGPALAGLVLDQKIRGIYRLKQALWRRSPQGKSFLLGQVQDATGSLGFVWWHADEQRQGALAQAPYLELEAKVELHKERLQLVLLGAKAHDGAGLDPASFQPAPAIDPERLWIRLEELIASIADPWLGPLLRALLVDDAAFATAFREAPAAVSMHHAWRHGLLAHTVAVTELALLLGGRYPTLDRDLLVAGALLHDACKCQELAWEGGPYRYTEAGNLIGHIPMGVTRIATAAAAILGFPARRLTEIQHLVLTHHGELAHGSPKEPLMIEAVVLHLIDNIDSRIAGFLDALAQPGAPAGDWTEPLKIFGRRMWRGAHA